MTLVVCKTAKYIFLTITVIQFSIQNWKAYIKGCIIIYSNKQNILKLIYLEHRE